MTDTSKKKFTFVSRSAPYGLDRAHQCLEMALATAVFEQPINYLFLGEGVLQLVSKQDVRSLHNKALGNALEALDLYGVEKPCVDEEALESCGLDAEDLVVPVELLDQAAIRELLEDSDVVVNL